MKLQYKIRFSLLITVLLVWCVLSGLSGEPPSWIDTGIWARTYGGEWPDAAFSVQATSDGGFILAGSTNSFDAINTDFYIVKTDDVGNEQWNRVITDIGFDSAQSVRQTTDGGFIIAGGDRFWVIKMDAEGNEEWNEKFGHEGDVAYSIVQTVDGGYVAVGKIDIDPYGRSPIEAWMVKIDSVGNFSWGKIFGTVGRFDAAYSVQQTADGGFILAGENGSNSADLWLIKTDNNGNEEWNRTLGGNSWDEGASVQQTKDGGYIAAGLTTSYGAGNTDLWVVKTDAQGNEEWSRTFGGIHPDEAHSVRQTLDGGYILAGYTFSSFLTLRDILLVKLDPEGNTQWERTIGGLGEDTARCVEQTDDGGYILCGHTTSYGAGSSDMFLMKTDPLGNPPILW